MLINHRSATARFGPPVFVLIAAAMLGTTAALIALDLVEAPYFRGTAAFRGFDTVLTSNATIAGTLAVPISFYVSGLLGKDPKLQRTGLLAGEAVANAEVATA